MVSLTRLFLLALTLAQLFTSTTAVRGQGIIGAGKQGCSILLRTLALCIEEHCRRDNPQISKIERFWETYPLAGTGVFLDPAQVGPIMSYQEALRYAHVDVEEFGEGNIPSVVAWEPLNATSLVRAEDWLVIYNGLLLLNTGGLVHGRNGVIVAVTSVFLPSLGDLPRKPFIGYRHRTPVAANIGFMPTRGQTLYIIYLVVTQITLAILPLNFFKPWGYMSPPYFSQRLLEYLYSHPALQILGDRTGVIAMADFVALFLFSSRNNILLWITDWSHGTFILLHRWVGYCTIIQTCMHSLLLLILYGKDHEYQSHRKFWVWGIVGTLAFVILWPASLLPVRQRCHEFFLISHQVLSVIALVGTFLHIYIFYGYRWGFEIWVYVGGTIWFLDRFIRVLRMFANGYRTAAITAIDPSGEYLRVEIDGIVAEGHVYLTFPTLGWRFWESHPFSVLSTVTAGRAKVAKGVEDVATSKVAGLDPEKTSRPSSSSSGSGGHSTTVRPRITLLFRPMTGITRTIGQRLSALGKGQRLALPVLVESSYHANPATRNLAHCTTLLCIAGGVGITAILPIVRTFGGARARVAWGMRNEWLLRAVESDLAALNPTTVHVETSIGQRLDVVRLLREELMDSEDAGDLGVVVCGPSGMSDDVRNAVSELGAKAKRGIVFIDEAFGW
ncbi:metalloreductase [Coprinopsis cinerea okayama7|uniref:Metalloreductase n=1 Tax=Coprinopsis cinerea (strain Okayama-7 / 130 / ATCC MYA-4618 / FGSC 9003) TaxID=240176 RepID=A8NCL0_COPC7|nr:metalloreductase [Coprinopsis cinerea okayama7\|eukprot:XP_001832554.2 metalloreductase [Coprinopsis cinerea okayama7\